MLSTGVAVGKGMKEFEEKSRSKENRKFEESNPISKIKVLRDGMTGQS